jgi:hypothetical protein
MQELYMRELAIKGLPWLGLRLKQEGKKKREQRKNKNKKKNRK